MTIKKAFAPLFEVLHANPKAKVADLLPQLEEIASAKTGGGAGGQATTFHRDPDTQEVVALRCSYHQLWFSPAEVEFGKKASSASGYNSYCKDGMSKWTSQLAASKKAKEQLLLDVQSGKVNPADIGARMDEIELARATIVPMEDETIVGYATLEDFLASRA